MAPTPTITVYVTLDSDLIFTYGGDRLADDATLAIVATDGVDVTVQLSAPISIGATHDEKGRKINWKAVAVASGSAVAWTFPCPRSPFTLTVTGTTTDAATGTTTTKTKSKKVRIEAGATGGARPRPVASHGGSSGQ